MVVAMKREQGRSSWAMRAKHLEETDRTAKEMIEAAAARKEKSERLLKARLTAHQLEAPPSKD